MPPKPEPKPNYPKSTSSNPGLSDPSSSATGVPDASSTSQRKSLKITDRLHPSPLPNSWSIFKRTGDNVVAGAPPITSPTFARGQSFTSDGTDVVSEFEVVMDDGTKHRRSVSVSTLTEEEEGLMAQTISQGKQKDKGNKENKGDGKGKRGFIRFKHSANEHTPLLRRLHAQSSSAGNDLSSSSDSDSGTHSRHHSRLPTISSISSSSVTPRHTYFPSTFFTPSVRNILKCVLAYTIAACFTFHPGLNALIGGSPTSSHLVATATVFFNPAKSWGSMAEAAGIGAIYGISAVGVCIASMLSTVWLYERDKIILAHIVSLVLWIGGSQFFIAFAKAKFNSPPINSASSLANIVLFVVLVKEGSTQIGEFSTQKIKEIFISVAAGMIISVFVCWLVWPVRSAAKLRKDIGETLSSYSTLLKLLTKTFLLDNDLPDYLSNTQLQKAIRAHRTAFTQLKKTLSEARRELFDTGFRDRLREHEELLGSLQRLALHLGGLRDSCGIQFEMLRESPDKTQKRLNLDEEAEIARSPSMDATTSYTAVGPTNVKPPVSAPATVASRKATWGVRAGHIRRRVQTELMREFSSSKSGSRRLPHGAVLEASASGFVSEPEEATPLPSTNLENNNSFNNTAESSGNTRSSRKDEPEPEEGALVEFIHSVRAPMKNLAFTSRRTLRRLEYAVCPTAANDTNIKSVDFEALRQSLVDALAVFEASQRKAVTHLYSRKAHHKANYQHKQDHPSSLDVGELAGPGEEVFLVYFFVFCLQEFTKELATLVEIMGKVCAPVESKSWIKWLISGCGCFSARPPEPTYPAVSAAIVAAIKTATGQSLRERPDKPAHDISNKIFQGNNHNLPNTLHTPVPTTMMENIRNHLWSYLSWFRQFQFRYALKAAVAAVLLSIPAFLDSTRPLFREYRGEWALISLMVVMVPTVGGTNIICVYRIIGTLIGCYSAVLIWTIFPANSIVLPIFTSLFSIPCFYIILQTSYQKMGQFTLLAYNLVLLQKYNYRNDDTVEVIQIAWHRAIAVSFGVFCGLLITNYIWPYEARVQLRKGLSDLLLSMGWFYDRLSTLYTGNTDGFPTNPTIVDVLDVERISKDFDGVELHLQVLLLNLYSLLAETNHEPRLKGPFPVATYTQLLTSCQSILDKLVVMRAAILRQGVNEVKKNFIWPAEKERKEMVGNVLLFFYVLASALRLKTPLPPYMPPAAQAWKNAIEKIRELPVVKERLIRGENERYIFYYAYIVMMEDLIRELDKLGAHMIDLFGVFVPTAKFGGYFRDRIDAGEVTRDPNRYDLSTIREA